MLPFLSVVRANYAAASFVESMTHPDQAHRHNSDASGGDESEKRRRRAKILGERGIIRGPRWSERRRVMRREQMMSRTAWGLSLLLGQASVLLGLMVAIGWTLALAVILPQKALEWASGPRMLL